MSGPGADDDWIDDLIADVHWQAKRHGVSFEYFMTRLLDDLWPIGGGGETPE